MMGENREQGGDRNLYWQDETPSESVDFYPSSTKQIKLLVDPEDKEDCFVRYGPKVDLNLF